MLTYNMDVTPESVWKRTTPSEMCIRDRHYAAFVMEQLGSELHYVCTINEANMGLQLAAISKRFRLMAEQDVYKRQVRGSAVRKMGQLRPLRLAQK